MGNLEGIFRGFFSDPQNKGFKNFGENFGAFFVRKFVARKKKNLSCKIHSADVLPSSDRETPPRLKQPPVWRPLLDSSPCLLGSQVECLHPLVLSCWQLQEPSVRRGHWWPHKSLFWGLCRETTLHMITLRVWPFLKERRNGRCVSRYFFQKYRGRGLM